MWPRNLRLDCQSHPGRPLILHVNEVHPPSSPHYQYVNLVSAFTKSAFVDAISLRYGWHPPPATPTHCVCGSSFTVQHVLSCPRGGFPIIRHNKLRYLTAHLLTEVCHDVRTEPDLQPLTGETLSHDVRVFNPLAASNSNMDIAKCYRKHENEKKRTYKERIRETEHSSFTPLVFAATGGMGRQATVFYQRLAAILAEKWDQSYGSMLNWLRCSISFSLLRSAIQCIRGARSSRGNPMKELHLVDLVVVISESETS